MNVLVLCTGNSCRSILTEATFNHLAPDGWLALSTGSHPTGQVHPRSLALLGVREDTGQGQRDLNRRQRWQRTEFARPLTCDKVRRGGFFLLV